MLSFEWNFLGLSSETKPVAGEKVIDGSTFYECDTGNFYIFYAGTWYKQTFITEDGINVYVYKYLMRKMFKRSFDSNITKTHIYRPDVGSNISFTSEYPSSITDMQIYGDTFQQTYSGKNLWNPTPYLTGYIITASGSLYATTDGVIYSAIGDFATNTYTLSMIAPAQGGNLRIHGYDGTGTWIEQIAVLPVTANTKNSVTFTVPSGIAELRWSFLEGMTECQLEAGSTPTDYEPFVGGTASPNPSYPQTVNVVTGEQNVWVHGKNLFNNNATPTAKINDNSLGITPLTTGIRLTSGASVSYSGVVYIIGKKKDYIGKTLLFTAHSKSSSTNNPRVYIGTCGSGGGSRASKANEVGNSGEYNLSVSWQVVDDDSNEYICIVLYTSASVSMTAGVYMDYTNTQLEIGSVASPYEPYQGANYTIDLGSTELCKIGNYQDYIYKSGDDWYVHKETKKVIFDGSGDEDWATGTSDAVRFFRIDTSDGAENSEHLVKVISDRFIGRFESVSNSIAISAGVQGRILIFIDGITNVVSTWKTWLSNNNVTAYYALATPTDTKITDNTLIAQLEDILTYEFPTGTNNIIVTASDLPALLKLTITERD